MMLKRTKHGCTRREFIKRTSCGLCAMGLASSALPPLGRLGLGITTREARADELALREVSFYKKLSGGRIECGICPRKCRVAELERGYCGNKENHQGKWYSLVYSRPCAVHTDPIEKKPLFHFLPGTLAFSIATAGCNIECKFCQNWQIAQFRPEQVRSFYMPPEEVVQQAKGSGCSTIAYTYSEPVVFYDFMHDTAKLGRTRGLRSVTITNGYINEKPLLELCKHLDAVKVDLKAFTKKFYKEICSGELEPVKKTLITLKNIGMWTEIVVLLVPTLNDGIEEIREMSRWIHGELGPDIPVHFSRFHPSYKIKNLPPTPLKTLEQAWQAAREEGLNYVYLGNVWGHRAESTYCPNCKRIIIHRIGYRIGQIKISEGRCMYCNTPIPGVWG